MPCCPQNDLKWIVGKERDGIIVKMQIPDVEKPVFCFVIFSFEFYSYCHKSGKENSNFSIFKNIRVTISFDGTFTHAKTYVFLIKKKSFKNFAL